MKAVWHSSGVAFLAAVAAMALGYNARAVTINMDTVLAGGFPSGDLSSKPYLRADIVDGTLGGNAGVYLTMSCPGMGFAGSGNYEHLLAWDFNVSSITGLTFTETAASGNAGFTLPTITTGVSSGHGAYQAATSGNYFDIQFAFAEGKSGTDGQMGGVEFGFGDSVTYFISGVTSSSFRVATLSNGSAGTLFSAAKIDDANAGTWVSGTTTTSAVPDAGNSALLLGLSLLGMGGLRQKFARAPIA